MHTDDYNSFNEYLKPGESAMGVRRQIKNDLESAFPDLFRISRKAKLIINRLHSRSTKR